MDRGDDDPHPAEAEDPLDAVLPGEDLSRRGDPVGRGPGGIRRIVGARGAGGRRGAGYA